MLSTLVCAIIGLFCALYGIYKFTGDYTCWLVKWNKTLKNGCRTLAWLPSACVVGFVLGITIMRANALQ